MPTFRPADHASRSKVSSFSTIILIVGAVNNIFQIVWCLAHNPVKIATSRLYLASRKAMATIFSCRRCIYRVELYRTIKDLLSTVKQRKLKGKRRRCRQNQWADTHDMADKRQDWGQLMKKSVMTRPHGSPWS